MNKLTKTAKTMDNFIRILSIFIAIGAVTCVVGLGIIAAGFLFNLDPYVIGTGYNSIEIGNLDFVIAKDYAPDEHFVLMLLAVEIAIVLVFLVIARLCCNCVRDILHPMTQGEPFHGTISTSLKKLARYSLILCVATNCVNIVNTTMFVRGFDLPGLLLSDKITNVTFNTEVDLTFVLVAAVLYLLSYVFRYGEELQQLSDETL